MLSNGTVDHITYFDSVVFFLTKYFGFLNDWQPVKNLILIILFLLVFCIIEIFYSRWHCLSLVVPKPGVLLLCGVCFGYCAKFFGSKMSFFNEFFFFGILFPPLVFSAALDLKSLFRYGMFTAVAVFGIVGSLANFVLTGLSLWGVYQLGWLGIPEMQIKPIGFVIFSSLVCSTDLAIVFGLLGKLKVHPILYMLFVGESLFNDGVSISLFLMSRAAVEVPPIHLQTLGIPAWFSLLLLSFSIQIFICSLIGVLFGFLSCIITRWTEKEASIEPVIVFCLGYSGYLLTYTFAWPSTFCLIFFCTILSNFTFRNLCHKSIIAIRHTARMASTVADSMIFLYVGFSVASHKLQWHAGLTVWTIFFCVLWRFAFVYLASYMANRLHWTRHRISPSMMFFISFGGFKGSVAHALSELVSPKCSTEAGIPLSILRCSIVFINLFYVVFIGVTMTPLLRIYKFMSSEPSKLSLLETLNERLLITATHAITDIVGRDHNSLRFILRKLYKRYLRPLILRDPNKHEEITDVYTEIALALHHASVARDKKAVHHHLRRLRPQLKKVFYYQHAVGSHMFALPNSQISLHHLDLLSGEVTHGSTGSTPGCADSIATEQQGAAKTDGDSHLSESSSHGGPVSYHTANGGDEGAPRSEAPSSVSARPRRCLNCARACGTSDTSEDSGTEDSTLREILKETKNSYVFDEFTFMERFGHAIQKKQRAIKIHHGGNN